MNSPKCMIKIVLDIVKNAIMWRKLGTLPTAWSGSSPVYSHAPGSVEPHSTHQIWLPEGNDHRNGLRQSGCRLRYIEP